MTSKPNTPRNAAATILIDRGLNKVLWARRNPKLKFLGGFHGFPGGKVDRSDSLVKVRNADSEKGELIACAVRELFEEVGILLVRNGDKLTVGQIASLHDDLISGRSSFAEILKFWGLWIDADDFEYTGFWTTPEFSPVRFKTHFFIASCPPKQKPYQAITELQEIEFIDPKAAFELWANSKVLIAPPVQMAIREFADAQKLSSRRIQFEKAAKILKAKSEEASGNIDYIELNSRLICLPLRTDTLPPATHTNCFIVGKKEFVVIDAASPYQEEQQKLFKLIDTFLETGCVCKEIVVSHLHNDHFGGETVLQHYLKEKFDMDVPISAHKTTAKNLDGVVSIDKLITPDKAYTLQDDEGKSFKFNTLHTPGHARGHLCFYDEEYGFLLSSDNVVGLGTVVIAPPEGNMTDYLASLESMKNLPSLNFLCGSHGAAVYDAKGKIDYYIEHRLMREEQVLQAVAEVGDDERLITDLVYSGIDPSVKPLAQKSVEAHLEKLRTERRI